MIKVFKRLDYFLLVMALLGAYSGWKYENVQVLDYILPLVILIFIYISKRNGTGAGFSGFLAFVGTTLYFIGHWEKLLQLDLNLLLANDTQLFSYGAISIGAIIFICIVARLTTYVLTITWTVYYILLLFMIVSEHPIGKLISLLNSSSVKTGLIMGYSSILILSIIGGILADLELRKSVRN